MNEYMHILWIILIVLFCTTEMFTFNLVTIWMAIASLIALIVSRLGAGVAVQVWTFLIMSALLVILTKPIVQKVIRPKNEATNADRVVGKTGIVTEKIDPIEGTGKVKVMGNVWSAAEEQGGQVAEGLQVEVIAIKGVKLTVKALKEEQ